MPGKMMILLLMLMSFRIYGVNKVVYGIDDRVDYDQYADSAIQTLAKSTAAMISKDNVNKSWWSATISGGTLGDMGVCSTELFTDQLAVANCSGFLVAPDIIVTAGHCIQTQDDCDESYWVFDYVQANESAGEISISSDSVYSCESIIHTTLDDYTQNDFAIIRLDREVEDRVPLQIRSSGKISDEEDIIVMGYPSGLPLKIAAGATVRDNDDDYFFSTNLDTFGGNSGSAVINAHTGEVEGILVRGDQDYTFDYSNYCQIVNVCSSDGCRGEDVTRITNLKEVLDDYIDFEDEVQDDTNDSASEAGEFTFAKDDIGLAIEDKNTSTFSIDVPAITEIQSITLTLAITHTYIGDLKIVLVHPSGESITLRNREGGSQDDLVETYEIDSFMDEDSEGEWKLEITDQYYYDEGDLDSVEFVIKGVTSSAGSDDDVSEDDSCDSIWNSILRRPLLSIYRPLINLCGVQFRSKLKEIISKQNSLGYTGARKAMFSTIDNHDGEVCSVYSSECVTTSGIPNSNVMNCEHSWPQSLGATGVAKADLHHLFPTMSKMNSRRSNYPFCEVDTATYDGESKLGYKESVRCFEPMDSHKGDLARAMFYFAVRYGKEIDQMQEGFFRKWNREDVISQKEINRNDAIEDAQNNRNPFVDYPQFVSLITDF